MTEVVHRDRLSATADKWLFFVVWLLGTAGIVLFKRFGAAWQGLVWGLLMLLIYALAVWRSPRFRVREDRAGDSAYYLGFLFTLTSLAYSLWEFGANRSTINAIIGNFAIALGTTIVGLALRVLFQQFREDPIEIEQQVRLEISDRVAELRSQLLQVVEDLSSLSTTIRTELKDRYAESLFHITGAASERMKAASDEHLAVLKRSLESFVATSETIKEQASSSRVASKRLIDAVERLAERTERAEVPTEKLRSRLDGLATVIADAVTAERQRLQRDQSVMDKLKELADSAMTAIALVAEEVPKLRDSIKQASIETAGLGAAFGASKQQAEAQVQELAASAVKQSQILEAMKADVERALAAVRQNERELVEAVGQSRKAVVDTQKTLASLAKTVVEQVHAR